ncbi:MAG TPA: FAD-dependent oxidoreductase [Rubrobacter sp.]|nr:FAD-dependent oxidoreductase [Rubrobacter sp.]
MEAETDILVVGGGLGGVAGALAALRLGRRVVLTEETDWIGGQLTAQAVPPDEHPWIEDMGCTASYRRLRNGIRYFYRRNYPLTAGAHAREHLNPGDGLVSRLCHEPRVSLAVLEGMLAPYRSGQRLRVLLRHRPVAAEVEGDLITAVTLLDGETGEQLTVHASYVLDATELGDLLELAGVEHAVGAESRDETGEPHALPKDPNPLDQQAVSWCFPLDYMPGEDHTIDRPEDYDYWRSYRPNFWPGPLLSWTDVYPDTLQTRQRAIFHEEPFFAGRDGSDLWHYRRILARENFSEGLLDSDITLVNWPQIDYWLDPLVGVGEAERREHMQSARQLSLSMLYWMQTEAPKLDGGVGYRGLRLRPDVVGTSDGLAKHIYVRESRRIRAEFTVLEQHVGVEARGGSRGAQSFHDSVGIGAYRIDLHPSAAGRSYVDVSSWPFQIPLGALIPVRVKNLLPACKNPGTTHITNGCYRLHPVEWNIGEASGALAAYCLDKDLVPRQVREDVENLEDFQRLLTDVLGFELAWPEPQRYESL